VKLVKNLRRIEGQNGRIIPRHTQFSGGGQSSLPSHNQAAATSVCIPISPFSKQDNNEPSPSLLRATMCFYDQYIFACGDIEWACFRQFCPKNLHIRQVCGKKMEMAPPVSRPTLCRICLELKKKTERIGELKSHIRRMKREGSQSEEVDPRNDFLIATDLQRIEDLREELALLQEHATTSKVISRFNAVEEIDKLEDAHDAINDEKMQFQKTARILAGVLED